MIGRRYVVPALVLGAAMMAGDARADFAIPATAGMPGFYGDVNSPGANYWAWQSDVYISRFPRPLDAKEWVIPLVFHGEAGHRNKWAVSVMVSAETSCFVQWWPQDVESGPMGTTPTHRSDAGTLPLTSDDLCADAEGCITSYHIAQVSCSVGGGGFVGPVIYSLTDIDDHPG